MDPREDFSQLDNLMPLLREQLSQGKNVSIMPRGVSMLPMLRQGIDSVTLSPLPDRLRKYDLPLYRRPDGHYILHRIVDVGDTYTCIGDNQFRYEHGVRPEWMIAVVTSFRRGNREISVLSPLYRCYCFVWHRSRPLRHFWHRGIHWLGRHFQ